MFLTNLTTELTKTATTTSFALVVPADRLGLGCGAGQNDYPADDLSRGHIPVPANPEPEQLRSRQGRSAPQMRKQLRTDVPPAVPPAGSAGSAPPVARVNWRTPPADTNRNRNPLVPANACSSDCHSPAQLSATNGTKRDAHAGRAAGK